MKIDFRSKSGKYLRRLPLKQQKQIVAKIMALRHNPMPQGVRPLKGKKAGFYRAKAGEYRIIYRAEGDTLFIEKIGKRNDAEVYR